MRDVEGWTDSMKIRHLTSLVWMDPREIILMIIINSIVHTLMKTMKSPHWALLCRLLHSAAGKSALTDHSERQHAIECLHSTQTWVNLIHPEIHLNDYQIVDIFAIFVENFIANDGFTLTIINFINLTGRNENTKVHTFVTVKVFFCESENKFIRAETLGDETENALKE